jgi:hypothetical protein
MFTPSSHVGVERDSRSQPVCRILASQVDKSAVNGSEASVGEAAWAVISTAIPSLTRDEIDHIVADLDALGMLITPTSRPTAHVATKLG